MKNLSEGQRLLFSPGPRIDVERFAVPSPRAREVLVRVRRSQISVGSELNYLRHGASGYANNLPQNTPLAIGYMAVGEVMALGPEVQDFAIGDRVLTAGPHGTHWVVDCAHPQAVLDPIPPGVSDDAAGYSVLGDVALHGVRRATLQIDESVAVFGLGIVGLLTLQLARISGAHPLIAVDRSDFRLAKARECGATHTVNVTRSDPVAEIRAITQNHGAEVLFHCAAVPEILQPMLESAADRGQIVLTGSVPGQTQIRLQAEFLRRELSMIAVYETGLGQPHPYWRWTRARNRRACLRLMNDGALEIERLITHRILPEAAQATYEMMLKGKEDHLGIVISWD